MSSQIREQKWDVYLSICRKVETGGRGDDVSRDPRDLAMQQEFVATFQQYLPTGRVLAPGALTEAVMLAEAGYDVHALVLGADNARWHDENKPRFGGEVCAREHDAHDLDYPAGFFDGYFTTQVHEHLISPFVHIGEVRYCMRDGGVVFVDAAGTTNPDMRQIWHVALAPEREVMEQWKYWGFKELWRGPHGDDRPQFIFEKLPFGHLDFENSGYLEHVARARAAL